MITPMDIENKEFKKAYELYQAAYLDFKEDPTFLEKYCYFLLEDGKQEQAKEIAEQLVALNPTEQQYIELLERFE